MTRHLPRFSLVLLLCALLGCGLDPGAYPGTDQVEEDFQVRAAFRKEQGERCELVVVSPMTVLDELPSGRRQATYTYETDCTPKGGEADRSYWRVTYSEERTDGWLGDRTIWRAVHQTLDDPANGIVNGRPWATVRLERRACNAYVQRMIDEVLPCLRANHPAAIADLLQARITQFQRTPDPVVGTEPGNVEAATLARDTECLHHWRHVNAQLPSGSVHRTCRLED